MAMIAVPISDDISRLFTATDVPGTRDTSDHITLFYLGDNVPLSKLIKIIPLVFSLSSQQPPFRAKVKRITSFPKGESGYPVIAQVNSPELEEFRKELKSKFDRNDVEYSNKFPDYNPHITLSYSPKKVSSIKFEPCEFMVSSVALYGGDGGKEKMFVDFPFSLNIERKAAYLDLLVNSWKNMI